MQATTRTSVAVRVTLVLPAELWERVKRLVPAGQRSRIVVEALEAEINRREAEEQIEDLRQFQEYLFQKYGEMPSSADDINRMREERDAEILGLR